MPPSFADPASADDLAAAKARHPAGRLLGRRSGPPLRFAEAVALLTGPWRVSDPIGFAAAMTTDPTVAGHPVSDLSAPAGEKLVPALAGIAPRRRLALWWVSGVAAGHLHVEARAEAPAGRDGPEVFVVAHLVEPLGHDGRRALPADHSWAVVVLGDGSGGVAHVARATLACPRRPRCCPPAVAAARFPLAALRARLITPALQAEAASSPPPAAVLPLPRRG
ncbi:MAG TPA: hypothetical protein VGL92_11085 [Acidimicrobiia bacterium]|jgi:hypothetical protein